MAGHGDRFAGFDDIVTSEAELLQAIPAPLPQVIAKVTDHLDTVCRDFIARSPFCILASSSPDGPLDLSPKGDPPGFVQVLDDHRLAIPDRPGNRRADTFRNLLRDPRLGILFLIPGKTETLRISGEARIVRDAELRRSMAVAGKVPALALVVHVDRAFIHCPKCMIRSALWQPEAWPQSADLPDIGAAMIRQGGLAMTEAELFDLVEGEGMTALY